MSGKTATSVALAKKYGAACLTIDGIVTEALSTGSSSAGIGAGVMTMNTLTENDKMMVVAVVNII